MSKPTDIGIFESKTHLSEIIARVMAGERFYITRRGERVAELRPVEPEKKPLKRGCAANTGYQMANDFNAPLDDFEDYR